MRLLEFKVDKQYLKKDPDCDFTKIVAGSKNYLKAHFTFSEDWKDYKKAASFWRGDKEYARILKNDECMIPTEVLGGATFTVTILGQKGDTQIPTNRVTIRQEVSR